MLKHSNNFIFLRRKKVFLGDDGEAVPVKTVSPF